MVPPAITGTLEEINKSCETCIHDKDVAGILFTLSHHFYGDLLIPGKGIALHLLRDSGLFLVYRRWVNCQVMAVFPSLNWLLESSVTNL